MSQISIVNLSEVEKDGRFDAEFYKPEYLEKIKILERINSKPLFPNFSTFVKKGIFDISPEEYTKKGIPLIRVSNTKSFFIDKENLVYINEEIHKKEIKTELNKGDILFSKVGTLGEISINLDYDKLNFGQNNVGIKVKKKIINPLFLAVFLNTSYGKSQILRKQSGQVQQKIVLDDVKEILIPLLKIEDKIETLVKDSYQKLQTSKSLYKEAEEILLKELGLENYKPKHELIFSSKLSEVLDAERIDADYFQPKYKEIEKKIKKFENINLGDKKSFKIITGIYSETYSNRGTPYIRSVDVKDNLLVDSDNLYKTEEEINNKFKVREGDIITSRVGSIGTIGYIHKELDGSFISDNILRIRNLNKELNNLFLAFYLKKIGTIFMERLSRGSVQQRLNQETLKEIKIPLLPSQIQEKISSKIQGSFKLRKESKELLEKAKQMVEEEIEKEASK